MLLLAICVSCKVYCLLAYMCIVHCTGGIVGWPHVQRMGENKKGNICVKKIKSWSGKRATLECGMQCDGEKETWLKAKKQAEKLDHHKRENLLTARGLLRSKINSITLNTKMTKSGERWRRLKTSETDIKREQKLHIQRRNQVDMRKTKLRQNSIVAS